MARLNSKRERIGVYGLVGLFIVGAGYVGVGRLRAPSPVEIHGVSSPPVSGSTPAPSALPKGAAATEIVVDVSGAVDKPGVKHLPAGARVEDAIKEAAGAKDADLEQLNLAAKLEDGTVVYVPHKDATKNRQPVADNYQGGASAPKKYASARASSSSTHDHSNAPKHPTGKVSLNTGSLEQLETLPGVGPSTAQKILNYRQDHGGFGSVDELMGVKGIGEKKMEKLRPYLKL